MRLQLLDKKEVLVNNLRSIAFLALLAFCIQQANLGGQYDPETPAQLQDLTPLLGPRFNIYEAAAIHGDKWVGF